MPSRILRLWNPTAAAWEEVGDSRLSTHLAAADPHPGYLLESLLDAKGDLLAASGDNAPARLAVGATGQVLTADSAQPLGVKWADAPAGGGTAEVTITTDASLTAVESPANTFALTARLSPDAGNALALRGNGLYATDTAGSGGGGLDQATADALYVNVLGDTMTGPLTAQGTGVDSGGALRVVSPAVVPADVRVYGAGSATYNPAAAVGGSVEYGVRFTPTNGMYLVAVRWYRPNTSIVAPTSVRLWDSTATGAAVWSLTTPAAWTDTVVGWKEHRLAPGTEPVLVGGRLYALSYTASASTQFRHSSYTPVPDAGVTFTTHVNGTSGAYPTTTGANAFGIDPVTRTGLGTNAPAASGALRLPNGSAGRIAWRNVGDTADLPLAVNASDELTFNGVPLGTGGGGGLATDPLADAKGDLFAASGPDAVGRLALGTDAYVLTADSTQALGVRWAPAPGSAGGLPTTGGTMTGSILVGTTNTIDLGATAARWRKLWAVDGEFTNAPTVGGVALPTAAGVAATYLALAGGTLTGDLVLSAATPAVSLKQAADTQPRSRLTDTSLAFGPGGTTAPDATLQRTGAGALTVSGGGDAAAAVSAGTTATTASVLWQKAGSGRWLLQTVGDPAGSPLILYDYGATGAGFTERARWAHTGTLSLNPDAGQPAVAVTPLGLTLGPGGTAGSSRVAVGASVPLELYGWQVLPGGTDAAIPLGEPAHRWNAVYASNGTIQTSAAEAKQAITPLDPATALAAVLATDPVVFEYTPPERAAEWYELPDDPEQAEAVLHQRLTSAPLEAAARHQAGFVLSSPDYATDPLFETGAGQSNAANSVGVLIGAIHALERRLAALEGA